VTAAPERHTDNNVGETPENCDQRQGGEGGGGNLGGELSAPARRSRCNQGDRTDSERERRQSDERREQTPEDEEDADQVDVGSQLGDFVIYSITRFVIAIRISTRTESAPGEETRNRMRAPSATPGGSLTRTLWASSRVPVP